MTEHQLMKVKMFAVLPAFTLFVLYGVATHSMWPWLLLAGWAIYYPIHFLGAAIGHHKFFQHNAFKAKWWYPYVATFCGSIAFWGDPLGGALVHRIHHKYVDTDLDPHSPCHGRWHSFIGWMWSYKPRQRDHYMIADLIRNYPWLIEYRRWEFLVPIVFHTLMYLISPTLFLIVGLGCLFSIFNGLYVNAYAHDPTLPGDKSLDRIWLARLVNSVFLHKMHHNKGHLWDNSYLGVKDWSAPVIKYLLAADPNNVAGVKNA